ncbi:MAG: ATP-dependent DNA helicase UvrD2 [Microthrixaceae bacterium]
MDEVAARAAHGPSGILDGLNPRQRAAVTATDSPLRILAGAGSGKTRVLTHRIAHLAGTDAVDPQRVLAVTFTRKAAAELRERLARLGLRQGIQAGTFHAIAYAQLRQRWEERGVRPPELMDRKVGFVARLCPRGHAGLPLDVTAELEWAAARLVEPADYAAAAISAGREPPLDPEAVADIYDRYREAKRRRRLVDFDDLLRLAVRDLEADPVYATARRWRFRHLYVDEFQDVNPLQHRLLTAWLGSESTLCVVGDPNQAIYSWNGADARYLVEFDRYFPGGSSVTLVDNYRSTPEILTTANSVLAAGRSEVLQLRANRPSGERPRIRSFPDETEEARAIARALRDNRRPGDPWHAQAVLVRTNAQAAPLAEALGAAGIPHRVRGSGSLLEQPEVRDALRVLRGATSVAEFLRDCSHAALEDGGEPGAPHLNAERRANLEELVRLGNEYLGLDPGGSPTDFSSWVHSTLRQSDSRGDAVEIVTFHAAKGLEWPVVHLAGLEKGFVPIHHAEADPEATEEERRLLYVALTRARDQLSCSHAHARTFGARTVKRAPSPWLAEIESALGEAPARTGGRSAARSAAGARSELRARARARRAGRPDLDEASARLFEELRSWRLAQARKADVPAYVVFNDETLRALAVRRPRSTDELLEVPGIGAVKADRFGEAVLGLIEASSWRGSAVAPPGASRRYPARRL